MIYLSVKLVKNVDNNKKYILDSKKNCINMNFLKQPLF